MKDNFIHICFVIDTSGSMGGSEADIVGGFNHLVEEQKKIQEGECVISMFTFGTTVKKKFIGKKLDEIKPMCTSMSSACKEFDKEDYENYVYKVGGMTAMNDGIGTAIDEIGQWLDSMKEEEKPSQNLIVIMTDGEENASTEYSLKEVQEKIKHQTEKYNWTFVYMGVDITKKEAAENLGIKTRSYSSKGSTDMYDNYNNLSCVASVYRCSVAADATVNMTESLNTVLSDTTAKYEAKLGIKIED